MTPDAQIEITIDDAYLREFHEEWIAVLGPGWRFTRRLVKFTAVVAIFLAPAALAAGSTQFLIVSGCFGGVAAWQSGSLYLRRQLWLTHLRRQDWFGRTMTIELREGSLVQVKDFAGDPRYERTGEILQTPNGWLVRYRARETATPANEAISAQSGSVYLAHRKIHPAMSREEFARQLKLRS